MKKIFFIFLFCLCAHLYSSPGVFAQVLIEQGKIKLNPKPGETITGTVRAHNTGKEGTLSLRVYWEDFEYIFPFDGTKKFMARGMSSYSCAPWISFSPAKLNIEPLGKEEISYTISVPSNAKGGYYGVLFFETDSVSPEGNIGLRIVSRVGSLFFIEVNGGLRKAVINDITLKGQKIEGIFINQGDIFLTPQGQYYVLDSSGVVVSRSQIDKFYLPPQNQKQFNLNLPSDLIPGAYNLVLMFDLEGGASIVKEIDFKIDNANKMKLLEIRD